MDHLAAWVTTTGPSRLMQNHPELVMYLQTIHILAVAMVLSAAMMISLRILRVTHLQTMAQTVHRFMPWLWTGMIILAGTGLLQILAEPKRTLNYNNAFMLKMAMLVVAVGLVSTFQFSLQTNAARWEDDSRAKTMTQGFAIFMLLLWFAIAVAGRWIAYARLELM
jgi:hypothetical protein